MVSKWWAWWASGEQVVSKWWAWWASGEHGEQVVSMVSKWWAWWASEYMLQRQICRLSYTKIILTHKVSIIPFSFSSLDHPIYVLKSRSSYSIVPKSRSSHLRAKVSIIILLYLSLDHQIYVYFNVAIIPFAYQISIIQFTYTKVSIIQFTY